MEKIDKYQPQKIKLDRLQDAMITVIPVVLRVLGAMPDTPTSWPAQIPGHISESDLQKSALLETLEMLRCVLRLPGIW